MHVTNLLVTRPKLFLYASAHFTSREKETAKKKKIGKIKKK